MPKGTTLTGQDTKSGNTGGATIGATAVAISVDDRPLKWGVQIVADSTNTVSVWVGLRLSITAGTGAVLDGVELPPKGTIHLAATNEKDVYAIAGAADQKISFSSH